MKIVCAILFFLLFCRGKFINLTAQRTPKFSCECVGEINLWFALTLSLRVYVHVCVCYACVGHVCVLQPRGTFFRKQQLVFRCKQYCSTTTRELSLYADTHTRMNIEQQLNCLLTPVHITFKRTSTNFVWHINYCHDYGCVSRNKVNICETHTAVQGVNNKWAKSKFRSIHFWG